MNGAGVRQGARPSHPSKRLRRGSPEGPAPEETPASRASVSGATQFERNSASTTSSFLPPAPAPGAPGLVCSLPGVAVDPGAADL